MKTALLPMLGRRDRRAYFDGRWKAEDGDPADLLEAHLNGELLLGPKHGGVATTQIIAWDIDGTKKDRPHRDKNDPRTGTLVLLDILALCGLVPPIVASSKSGTGFHPYVLLSEPIACDLAHAFAVAVAERSGRPRAEVDRFYPSGLDSDGLVLALPGCALNGPHPVWLGPGGSRFVHSFTLRPYPDADQELALSEWPRSTLDMVTAALARLEASKPRPTTPEPQKENWKRALPVYRNELDVLAESCEFVKECANAPERMTYEMWFSLATVLKPFAGGEALFDAISATDSGRYREREARKKIDSVRGAPRHCDNLGWSCPNSAACSYLGVKSPAGLPFKLKSDRQRGSR